MRKRKEPSRGQKQAQPVPLPSAASVDSISDITTKQHKSKNRALKSPRMAAAAALLAVGAKANLRHSF
jgi:hypothetical protein